MLHPRMLGCLPRPPEAKFAKLSDHLSAPLPCAPASWDGTPGALFGMFRNDELGDCTAAAMANLAALQGAQEDFCRGFTDEEVVSFYFAGTGGKDEGAVEIDVLNRVLKTGFPLDGSYKIDAFAAVNHHDLEQTKAAAATFKGLYVGAQLPLDAQDQEVWEVTDGPGGEPGSWGGHAMAVGAFEKGLTKRNPLWVHFITWGKPKIGSWPWWLKHVDEAYVTLDKTRAAAAKSMLDYKSLVAVARALGGHTALGIAA